MQLSRQIYYNVLTGDIFFTLSKNIENSVETIEEKDIQTYQFLQKSAPEVIGCIQLDYGEKQTEFMNCSSYYVDINTGKLVFKYVPTVIPLDLVKKNKLVLLKRSVMKL